MKCLIPNLSPKDIHRTVRLCGNQYLGHRIILEYLAKQVSNQCCFSGSRSSLQGINWSAPRIMSLIAACFASSIVVLSSATASGTAPVSMDTWPGAESDRSKYEWLATRSIARFLLRISATGSIKSRGPAQCLRQAVAARAPRAITRARVT